MIVVAVVSAKGGVGKSTIAANLAVVLARHGRTVLAVDLDPQNALHLHLGGNPQAIAGLSRASVAGAPWSDACVRTASGVHVLPFGQINEVDLPALERRIADAPNWLSVHLQRLDLPDDAVVILDTPPGVSDYLRQALGVADLVISVVLADAASYATLPQIGNLIRRYQGQQRDQQRSQQRGALAPVCIVNQVDETRAISRESLALIEGVLGERVIARVRVDQSVSEALGQGRTVAEAPAHSVGREDLTQCAVQVLRRLPSSSAASGVVPQAVAQPAIEAREQQEQQENQAEQFMNMVLGDDDRRPAAAVSSSRMMSVNRLMAVLLCGVLVLLIVLGVKTR
ncbi:cellulose biosynthesis protein BcsQ [Paraburkholderia sp. J67]|uniref:cellulose biosynthesis protein BcsQ n=1 Tax=Paraburkholderia sp. J67 TaxID=2805435 RepID=UPI002ABD2A9F|nr:cellulose biosynthesis protein BcsQ [Paraburkholderia sp. J67]